MLDASAIIRRKPSLIAAGVADEAILLDVDSGYFFQLNKSAAQIWNLVEEPLPLAEICTRLDAAFEGVREEEVVAFVTDMHERGLLEVEG
jgi:hypothetical protein